MCIRDSLISRVKIYNFNPHNEKSIRKILNKIIIKKTDLLNHSEIIIEDDVINLLSKGCGGDARKAIDTLELAVISSKEINKKKLISKNSINDLLKNNFIYDRQSDNHYSHISAFIKSIRGSDPNAAIYYLARMLRNGEDPLFIGRRLIISASEDIGLADPNAMLIANSAFESVNKIGMPEGRIPLANATIYLCLAEKSNSSYVAINSACLLYTSPSPLD